MADPTTNKPASVQLHAVDADGNRTLVRTDASGNLKLAADIDIDTSTLSTAMTDGTQKVKTSLPTSTHIGTNANPNGSAVQFGSQATTIGIATFAALSTNTAEVFIGRGSGVTTSTGIPIAPGQSVTLPCANINEYYVISAASQNVRALAF